MLMKTGVNNVAPIREEISFASCLYQRDRARLEMCLYFSSAGIRGVFCTRKITALERCTYITEVSVLKRCLYWRGDCIRGVCIREVSVLER